MSKINFDYNTRTHQIEMHCDREAVELTLGDLYKIKASVDNTISKYKSEHIKLFQDGDYIINDRTHSMFIFKMFDYSHQMYNFPSDKVTVYYHIRVDGNCIYDNQSFVYGGEDIYRKADPEEVAYIDYLLRKRQGVYFDKKDKKVKKL